MCEKDDFDIDYHLGSRTNNSNYERQNELPYVESTDLNHSSNDIPNSENSDDHSNDD